MLALDNIGAAYGMSQVLNGIALTVAAGEAVALLGRNGVGKTTLLRTIVGLHPANTGSIAFDERNVVKMPAYRRARLGIGYVPQGRGIFPQLTVAENLSVGASALDGRTPAVAPDPAPLYDLFPALTKLRDRKGGVLSGGEQQQLALARALLGKPRLLLLDEPAEGIQPNVVAEIGRILDDRTARTRRRDPYRRTTLGFRLGDHRPLLRDAARNGRQIGYHRDRITGGHRTAA